MSRPSPRPRASTSTRPIRSGASTSTRQTSTRLCSRRRSRTSTTRRTRRCWTTWTACTRTFPSRQAARPRAGSRSTASWRNSPTSPRTRTGGSPDIRAFRASPHPSSRSSGPASARARASSTTSRRRPPASSRRPDSSTRSRPSASAPRSTRAQTWRRTSSSR